ncbi:MAG TPA: bifunctional adenosylcobinamide kinase/adenosylcobinamide-phosphate guanylyltransferase [Candidatus Baltobacteraceae bacterium]|nr:bifunctional adenosylcobinamide kinase/adenosylcobinamide-phosphate guanylyltransferase [Candidatus Baltobacteraceae bacterium]
MAVTLVTGPVRSGKSRYVVALAQSSGRRVSYVATSIRDSGDGEWNTRLERHIHDRPATWELIESASLAHESLTSLFRDATEEQCIIVDALGTWLAARIATHIDILERDFAAFQSQIDEEAAHLAQAMLDSRAQVIVVAEEVGWDIVPVAVSARLFRDVLGRMKQQLAAQAGGVFLVVCGYALDLRALGMTI